MTVVPGGPRCAVVVAGGSARRMGGVDKLALDVGGRPLLDHVLAAARPLCTTVVVVGPRRPTGVEAVTFTTEAEPGGGPVPAVAAGMASLAAGEGAGLASPGSLVAVLAADLPLLTTTHLEALFAALGAPSAEAAAAVDDEGRLHPLLAVHRGCALAARLAGLAVDGPGLAGVAASQLLPPGTVAVAFDPAATLNVNRPEDLDRARSAMTARS